MLVILDKLNFYLYKFWGFIKPRRKLGLVSFVVLASFVLVVWVVGTNVAHAAGVLDDVGDFFGWHPIDDLANGIFQMIINIMLQIARWFIQLTFWILKFVIEIGGYNGYIDSPAVTVGWVMVRDITNMFFVVVLLIISFGTILGLEQYEYKKLLVKLLMAAVIVNFSRIICGIIIDVAQVIMITFINGIAATGDGNLLKMFHIEAMYKLKGGTAGSGVFMTAVAAITFASIMMVTMLTFLFLLLARMVMLWILIVLSPFAFVLNVLPQTQKYAGQWWSEFGGNVVAGPIIAFFLWLSFVTVGAGDARTHLANNSTTSWKEGATPQETTTGITEIMSWENMANFAIAIGMLLAGAKMAQQLGAAGGSMMGKAGEFGKKVAMVASGATAARWAGRGVLAGAKKAGGVVAMKFPVIGGEHWQRRGRNIQSRVSGAWSDWKGKRTIKAGEISKAMTVNEKGEYVKKVAQRDAKGNIMKDSKGEIMYEKQEARDLSGKVILGKDGKPVMEDKTVVQGGVGDWSKRMFARARLGAGVGYGAFKEEASKDLAETAESKKGMIEHLASTSSLRVGMEKRKAAVELEFQKTTGQDIKAGRVARAEERQEEIMKVVGAGTGVDEKLEEMGLSSREILQAKQDYARLGKAATGKAQAKSTKEYTEAEKSRREAGALDKFMAGKGGAQEGKAAVLKAEAKQIEDKLTSDRAHKDMEELKKLLMGRGAGTQEEINKRKAIIESMTEEMDLGKNKSLLLARAEEYRNPERPGGPDLLKASLAEQQAHSLELNKLKDVYKNADIGANERGNIAAQLVQKMEEVRNSSLSDPEKKVALKSLVKQKDSLHDFSLTQASYDAVREEEEELRQLGWSEEISNDNVGRRFLSRRLGKKIDAGGEKNALNEYRDLVGDDEFQVRMRQFGAHAKVQQAQGNAGAFVYKDSPNMANGQLTGLTDYEPVIRTGAEVVNDMSGWLKNNFMDAKKMLQATGTRRLGEKPGSGSVLVKINEDEASFNAEALGNFTSQSIAAMGKRGFIGDLNGSAIDKASLAEQLSAFAAKATNKQAFDALTKNLKDVLTKLKVEQKELDELWNSVKPTTKP